jgi:flagellar hook assembly protein FlgD
LPGENITSNWIIYDAAGREVQKGIELVESAPNKFDAITWDGRSHNGSQLMGGVYYYQIILTTDDGLKQTVGGKFIKL